MTQSAVPAIDRRPSIELRHLEFDLRAEGTRHWHGGNPFVTHFFNALFIMFPEAERFFMSSVRRFEHRVGNARLRAEVRAFLDQEALHSSEHRRYNEVLIDQGYPVRALERWLRACAAVHRRLPARVQLAVTCGLEHLTTIMAEVVLHDPEVFQEADPSYARLWGWHALEESEHKSVAFDVYRTLARGLGGYLRRLIVMPLVTALFVADVLAFELVFVFRDRRLLDLTAWRSALRFFWRKPGFVRQIVRPYFRYYHPGFHPWQHDNSEIVARWKRRYA